MRENTTSNFADQEFWTPASASAPTVYDFHLREPQDAPVLGIEAQEGYEPHAPTIHATEPDLSDEELDEFEARLERDDQLRSVRQYVASALRSAQTSADLESADSISRDLLAALRSLDQVEGGRINV